MSFLFAHVVRAWKKHLRLQVASLVVLTAVLVVFNLLYFSYGAFNATVSRWGRDLSLTLYLKNEAPPAEVEALTDDAQTSGAFEEVRYVSKASAASTFMRTLGPSAEALANDPKWENPLPASLELRLSDRIAASDQVLAVKTWAEHFRKSVAVDDVAYGQAWVENLGKFLRGVERGMILLWGLALGIGFLVVSNCIRLSILQRGEEIAILELVGATKSFVRWPFVVEGLALGLGASALSLTFSFLLHQTLLREAGQQQWDIWLSGLSLSALPLEMIVFNVISGILFGGLGAWACVRRMNTQWAAATPA